MSSRLVHVATGRTLAHTAAVADSFLGRLIGWIGRDIPVGAALGISGCQQIHTFGVRASIDCAYCNRDGRALRVETLAPNRVGRRVPGAWIVWETAAGALTPLVVVGDRLVLTDDVEG